MVDMDGTGDGDGGKYMWVMGTPIDGGGGGRDPAAVAGAEEASSVGTIDEAGVAAWKSSAENASDMTGAVAGSAGMPP
jgi:hypothetical protein